MRIKQKATLSVAIIGLVAGLMGAVLVAVLPGGVAYAQEADPCSTVPSGWSETLAACKEAVENDGDPCAAIYDTLVADGNDAADEQRDACLGAGGEKSSSSDPNCDSSKETCCGKVETSIITGDACGDGDNSTAETSTIFALLKWVLKIMTAGVGITAVGGIVYGSLLYSSARDNPEQTKRAISVITNVVVGLLAYAFMAVILNFLIPGGIFK